MLRSRRANRQRLPSVSSRGRSRGRSRGWSKGWSQVMEGTARTAAGRAVGRSRQSWELIRWLSDGYHMAIIFELLVTRC